MCTAISLRVRDHYFGRNLDMECSYGESVCVIPRRFPFELCRMGMSEAHYAIIGMAAVVDGVPLMYDGTNECGLSAAGLNFPDNAYYHEFDGSYDCIAPFEFIPLILGKCKTVSDARVLLDKIRLVNIPFNKTLPLSPLHWMISDCKESIVVEPMKDGLHIYDNPVGVMTNNPPFDYQLFGLNNYRSLSVDNPATDFSSALGLTSYCRGLGAQGLPGDVSSMSRFVRAVFNRNSSVCSSDEESAVGQFFHLLSSVEMIRGLCMTESGRWDITLYSSCVNTQRGLYYYTTYDNRQISCVDMHAENLDGDALFTYPLAREQSIFYQNKI